MSLNIHACTKATVVKSNKAYWLGCSVLIHEDALKSVAMTAAQVPSISLVFRYYSKKLLVSSACVASN